MRIRPLLVLALLAAALLAAGPAAAPAAGQRVVGTVRAGETGRPLPAAFVALVDSADIRIAGALTGPHGRFVLAAPRAGAYRVRVEMIGYRAAVSPALELAPDSVVRHDVRLGVEAVALDGLEVSAETSGCRVSPEEGESLDRLWREARKALNVVAWAEREHLLRYDIERYTRQLSPVSLRVLEEERDTLEGLTVGRPFRTLPIEELDRGGYVRQAPMRPGRYSYYGPDADVVLSDRFVERHCFWIDTDPPDDAPWIGLAFRPRERRDITDIAGVLWLDRATAELRVIEYRYTPLPPRVPARNVGGRIEFERLPSGAWIIDRWWIRTPGAPRELGLAGIEESGAVVLQARTVEELAVIRAEARVGIVTGSVMDHGGEPLPGAVVYLSGTEHRDTTGEAGRYRLRAPAGRYTLTFHHPALDSLGVFPAPTEIDLEPGDSLTVRLTVPGTSPGTSDSGASDPHRPGTPAAHRAPAGDTLSGRYLVFPIEPIDVVVPGRSPILARRGCSPAVYLDGSELPDETAGHLLNALPAGTIEGIEIYASAAATPAEFSRNAVAPPGLGGREACGAIVIWTRRER